jgi:signal transduction histidine kinase
MMTQRDRTLTLTARDDGKGFDTSAEFAGHLGLRSMRERVERLGGEIAVVSEPGSGTEITVRVRTERV